MRTVTRIAASLGLVLAGATSAEILAAEPVPGVQTSVRTLSAGATSPPAEIEQLHWLSGYWRGTGLEGDCEEIWGEPAGDRMMGVFSMSQNDSAVFSEHMMIVEEHGSLVLKVKHFSSSFEAWEEKDEAVEFPLVALEERAAYFDGLTARRLDGDRLEVVVRISDQGATRDATFEFDRVDF